MEHCEIERKFLIAMPDKAWLQSRPGLRQIEIVQTYLSAETGWERRVRRSTENGRTRCTETRKSEAAGLVRTELEREIAEEEYNCLLRQKLAGSAALQKVRCAFPYEGHTIEIDLYPFWAEQAILEVELCAAEESVSLPPEITVLREVTDDPELKNQALALARKGKDRTPDFRLRPWRREDAATIAPLADNPKIARWLRDVFPSPYTLRDAESYVEGCIMGEEQELCRAIEIDGRAVGSIGVFPGSDVYRKSGELGYWLAEEYWGRGIMTAAVCEICREAFGRFSLIRIFAEPFAENKGSRRVLEKAGFTLEGVMKNGITKNGRRMDYCMYAWLGEEQDRI